MNETILFVDDDIQVVTAIQRSLYKSFRVEIACGPADAIEAITNGDDYAVVVSDVQMPGMSGIDFLAKVKEVLPDCVSILLTGHADVSTAIAAVNAGSVFRFLTKPCPRDLLISTLDTALERHRLIASERELLQETLMGTVEVLMQVLGAMHPAAFGRARRIRAAVRHMAMECHFTDLWQFEAAAMLAQIGCVSLAPVTLEKFYSGRDLTAEETAAMRSHPKVGKQLLAKIPRLQSVARMIECQYDEFVDGEVPAEEFTVRLGAQMLLVAIDFDRLLTLGAPREAALAGMRERTGVYNPILLDSLARLNVQRLAVARNGGSGDEELAVYRPIANRVSQLLR